MAKTNAPAPSVETQAPAPSVMTEAEQKAKARQDVLSSLTFAELAPLAISSARWHDVLAGADRIAKVIEELSIAEKTASAQARKIGKLAPRECAMFRLAVSSYSLGKDRANPTQQAELAGKLASLRVAGSVKGNSVQFGGIILPPVMGEF